MLRDVPDPANDDRDPLASMDPRELSPLERQTALVATSRMAAAQSAERCACAEHSIALLHGTLQRSTHNLRTSMELLIRANAFELAISIAAAAADDGAPHDT